MVSIAQFWGRDCQASVCLSLLQPPENCSSSQLESPLSVISFNEVSLAQNSPNEATLPPILP